MKTLRRIDNLATGALILGALGTSLMGLTKTSGGKSANRHRPAVKLYYGLTGIVTIYKAIRLLTPKTQKERRVERIAQMYDQAESYGQQAESYKRAARKTLKQGWRIARSLSRQQSALRNPASLVKIASSNK